MKQVGIVRLHSSIIYGSKLQAYGLQETLTKLGADASLVNYFCEESYNQLKPFDIKRIKSIKSLVRELLRFPIRKKKFRNIEKFNNKYYKLGKRYCVSKEDLDKVNDDYDIFITGSDQVWNYELRGFDKAYYLDFVKDNKKKNSYAASFGISEIPDELKDTYRELLKNFNHVSIREEQGQKIYKELTGRDSELSIDPSLLLNREDWLKIATKPNIKGKYILVYSLVNTKTLFNFVQDLSAKTGYKIVVIGSYLKTKIKAKYYDAPSPDEFVGLFANAEYVVTNSFHGIAFSINMNRNFFSELQPPPAKRNSRLIGLLETAGLMDRLMEDGKSDKINDNINYDEVNKRMDIEREKSFKYLQTIINE